MKGMKNNPHSTRPDGLAAHPLGRILDARMTDQSDPAAKKETET